jgi:hypothetical protein
LRCRVSCWPQGIKELAERGTNRRSSHRLSIYGAQISGYTRSLALLPLALRASPPRKKTPLDCDQ